MIKKKFKDLDLEIYEHTLDNGFKIYVCKMDRYKIDARITVNVGGELEKFKYQNKTFTAPYGVSHFLEHKMFTKADSDISSIYEKNGAFGNAYTDDYSTVYHFSSPVKFWDNLEALFRCVNEPYFTDENVLKEKGIITQELMDLLSDPTALAYFRTKYNAFHNNLYKYPVIGTKESIESITKEDLYNVYNAFYAPSNMHLVVTGNVEPQKVIAFAEKYYQDKPFNKKGEKVTELEPKTVCQRKDIINKNINNKVCFINYKVNISNFSIPNFELQRYLNVLLLARFSSLSGFNDLVMQNENILSPISWRLDVKGNYANFYFQAETKDEEIVLDLLNERFNNLQMDEELLDLIKKNWINGYILATDNVIEASTLINEQIIKYGEVVYDATAVIKNLTAEKANEIFKQLDFANYTFTVVQK